MKRMFGLVLILLISGLVEAGNKQTKGIVIGQGQTQGQGQFRYVYRPDKLKVPEDIQNSWEHVHGIGLSAKNEIFVTYSTRGALNENTRGLIKFDLQGNYIGTLGSVDIAKGTPHGLDIHHENGEDFLYHSNNQGRVFKTNTQGEEIWSFDFPEVLPNYPNRTWYQRRNQFVDYLYEHFAYNFTLLPSVYMPCNIAFHPREKVFYMADCYGSSYVHKFSTEDGRYLDRSFGGKGDELGKFNTPHGLIYDARRDLLLIADRGNSRLQYFDFDERPVESVQNEVIQEPCDFDLNGDFLLIPDLSGHLSILDKDNKVVSRVDVSEVLGEQGGQYPHDAIFLPNFDIVVGTWNSGTLSYWERVEVRGE